MKGPRIGADFNLAANAMLTPEIRADLINLKGFKFQRDGKYDLPDVRLKLEDLQLKAVGLFLVHPAQLMHILNSLTDSDSRRMKNNG